MKKETTNTFEGGLVKDLHPLTTPKNVLTDALNATLITFNGNEMVLQNDMGNTKVGTAFLPKGYVPVGMKEHGGIIYVAAWNPESKKGQIGSYPSPKLLWEDEGWSVNSDNNPAIDLVSLNTSDFYTGEFITNEIVKTTLFKFLDGTMREFHPGDKYVICVDSATKSRFESYVNSGYIELQLGVIKKDGSIEIIANYKEDPFLFPINSSHPTAKTYITSNTPRVFNASSSGSLILIVNIVTYDSFELLRDYDLIESGEDTQVKVTFTGKATSEGDVYMSNDSGNQLRLYDGKLYNDNLTLIVLQGTSGEKEFDIYPHRPYGIVNRMRRKGKINFSKIKKSLGDFHEWRFFVTDDYIKIGWAYEYYNFGGKKPLKCVRMKFYEFTKLSSFPNSPVETIDFLKDSYSGNFEDYIRFQNHKGIDKGHIYIVGIFIVFQDNSTKAIAYKMLYVSKLYNEFYNKVYLDDNGHDIDIDFSTCVEFTKVPSQLVDITYDSLVICQKEGSTKAIVYSPNETHQQVSVDKVKQRWFVTDVSSISSGGTDEYDQLYVTDLENTYKGTISIEANYNSTFEDIIGRPNREVLHSALSGNISVSTNTNKIWNNFGEHEVYYALHLLPSSTDSYTNGTEEFDDNIRKLKDFTITSHRIIQGLSSKSYNIPYEVVDYLPIYDPASMWANKITTFSTTDNLRFICGCKHNLHYNCTFSGTDIIEGPDPDSGVDDTGLAVCGRLMNSEFSPTVTLFAGKAGEDASLRFDIGNSLWDRPIMNGWDCSDDPWEVDDKDNFMIATWKYTDGTHKLVNLFSLKDWPQRVESGKWPRLDVMLRCLLSLIFIANKSIKTDSYITTNDDYYRYLEGKTSLTISTSGFSNNTYNDIMLPYEGGDSQFYTKVNNAYPTLTTVYNKWLQNTSFKNALNEVKLTTLENLIPVINAKPVLIDMNQDLSLEEDFEISSVIKYYYGVKKELDSDSLEKADPAKIMIVDTSKTSLNLAAAKNGQFPRSDGTFVWDTTPALKEAGKIGSNFWNDSRDVLYDWTGAANWKMLFSLYRMFETSGEYNGWLTIEDDYNELLGRNSSDLRIIGEWVEGAPDAQAPDIDMQVLASNKSLYRATNASLSNANFSNISLSTKRAFLSIYT